MEVSCLPLSSTQRGKLISAGYTSLSFLSSVPSSDLSRDLNITIIEAQHILKIASSHISTTTSSSSSNSPSLVNGAKNAWDMFAEEESFTRSITTSSSDFDRILGGGIHCKQVTEIGGVPGIGKTQLGIQLAVNAQIPLEFGGLGGKAIYIDTEGSFMVERALQIAKACVEDMSEYSGFLHKDARVGEVKMQTKDILQNIYYFRICSYTEQIALINYLEKFVSEHKDVKVIVVDSITFHFRQDFVDLALRTRVLSATALKLMKLAKNFNLAVVLLNQVTNKYTDGNFQLTLALGDSWSHSCTNRIILYWNGNERYAYIDKSPSLPSASASYSVTSRGIRNSASNCKRIKMM